MVHRILQSKHSIWLNIRIGGCKIRKKTNFCSMKSCLNDAVMVIMQTTNAFGNDQQKVEAWCCNKDHRFLELHLSNTSFTDILINFQPKEATEFTTTAAVFRHITAIYKSFLRCLFFTLVTLSVSLAKADIKHQFYIKSITMNNEHKTTMTSLIWYCNRHGTTAF